MNPTKLLLILLCFHPLLAPAQGSGDSVVVQTVAGSGSTGYLDGVGVQTFLNNPTKILVSNSGEVLFYDADNARFRKISSDLTVSTFAGSGQRGYRDGHGTNALFDAIIDLHRDSQSNYVFIDSHRIRKMTPSGLVTTIGGSNPGYRDGSGNDALFFYPRLTIDSDNNIFVADSQNNRIRKLDRAGTVSTVAGSGNSGSDDGVGIFATFSYPNAIAVGLGGNVLIVDSGNRFRQMDSTGRVTTRNDLSLLVAPYSIGRIDQLFIDAFGSIYLATSSRLLKISADGKLTTAAGGSNPGYQDGPVASAKFCGITGFAFDSNGAIYVADSCNNRIRKVTTAREEVVEASKIGLSLYPGLTVDGIVGRSYRIEVAQGLTPTAWQPLTTITLDRTPYFWVDQTAGDDRTRLYRAVSLP